MALRYIRQLYSLDVLDTRFVIPATAPPKEALEEFELDPVKPSPSENSRKKGKSPVENAQPSLWNTPEFYFYYLVFLICIPLMIKSVIDVSKGQIKQNQS